MNVSVSKQASWPAAPTAEGVDPVPAGRGDFWREAFARSRLFAPLRGLSAGLGTCLMYHRISPDEGFRDAGFAPNRELTVSVSAFDAQMRFLATHYNCLALPEAIELLQAGRLPPRSVVVTFDDGYLDNFTLGLPILRAHGVPATVYVATGMIENTASLWWYELEHLIAASSKLEVQHQGQIEYFETHSDETRQQTYLQLNRRLKSMNPEQQDEFMDMLRTGNSGQFSYAEQVLDHARLNELAADPLITIGAHTHNHLVLSRLPDIRMRHEIDRSRELLQRWLDRPIEHLAYPFGGEEHAGEREFRVARELGFRSAVTTRIGHFHRFHRHHLSALPRVAVSCNDNMARFAWKLSGLECLLKRPSSRVRV